MGKKIQIIIVFLLLGLSAKSRDYKIWYDKPAYVWTEALPLGNGRLGAMVFGNPGIEQIQLNEETLWAGRPNNNPNPDALIHIPKVRELVFAGKYLEAQTLATEKVMSKTNSGMPYQSFGDLRISFPGHNRYTDYYRELNLDSACVTVRYQVDNTLFTREVFTSFPDQVVVMRLTANTPGKITFNAQLTSPHQDVMITTSDSEIRLNGVSSWHEGLKGKVDFQGVVKAAVTNGRQTVADGVLSVEQADEVVLYVSLATNFVDYQDITADPEARNRNYLSQAVGKEYADAKQRHRDYFSRYMHRMSIDLGENRYEGWPTDKRVADFSKNHDAHLVATYFWFGRYLLISCSQPGGQPANLQGIWNDKLFPSWDSKYTCNINAEMNYWPSEVTNLTEMNEPFFRMISEVAQTGKESARVMYGASGWVLHHNTDIWRITGAIDKAPSGMWPSGGAWLCRHLWEHYLYTGDRAFLDSVYPILKESARFFDEVMVYEPQNNWLVVCPSNSPENTHAGSGGKATTAAGCTMDNQLIFDLWNSVVSASAILGKDDGFATRLKQRIKDLPPMQVGQHGQLQEWMFDWDNPKDDHRHVSHLYGLFPGNQISPFRTPELFDAARTSLEHRGDPSTGWSMGWKVCLWARLLDGNHAYQLITNQLTLVRNEKKKGGTYPNLFDAHPPFQIDGNFGCTAGIAEMLMQSYDGFIYILPALPDLWKEGAIKGLIARGGFETDIYWSNGEVDKVVVYARNGGNCRLRFNQEMKGNGLKRAKGVNPNPLYDFPETPKPLISEKATLKPVDPVAGFVYDLQTVAGRKYEVYKK